MGISGEILTPRRLINLSFERSSTEGSNAILKSFEWLFLLSKMALSILVTGVGDGLG